MYHMARRQEYADYDWAMLKGRRSRPSCEQCCETSTYTCLWKHLKNCAINIIIIIIAVIINITIIMLVIITIVTIITVVIIAFSFSPSRRWPRASISRQFVPKQAEQVFKNNNSLTFLPSRDWPQARQSWQFC